MATIGTLLRTLVSGQFVGTDKFDNRYYRGKSRNRYNRERRWVVYKGRPEASKVPPEWHAWLHHISDEPLDNNDRHDWQQEHVPNLTGTRAAYHPLEAFCAMVSANVAPGTMNHGHRNRCFPSLRTAKQPKMIGSP